MLASRSAVASASSRTPSPGTRRPHRPPPISTSALSRTPPWRPRSTPRTAPRAPSSRRPSVLRVRRAAPEEQIELTGHLDELRSRLMVVLGVLIVGVALCFWQSGEILAFLQGPL